MAAQTQTLYLPQRHETLADLRDQGRLKGWSDGTGPEADPELEECYQKAASEFPCTHCGHRGMRIVGFHRGGTIRRFIECPECLDAEEV